MRRSCYTKALCCALICTCISCYAAKTASPYSGHTNNWAVIVNTSRYWFNYRHVANALSVYTTVKRLGIPDSNILLMLADDIPCNPRNPHPTFVFNNANQQNNLYDDTVEVDYRGYEVTAQTFLDVLNGDHDPAVPKSKRLLSNNQSNILVYITGHGGDGFMKFQDKDEATADEIGNAFSKMWTEGRYNELLFISDTCQAASLYGSIRSPNIVAMASSKIGEDSLSHHVDYDVGLSVIDRFTYYMLDFFQGIAGDSTATLQDLANHVRPKPLQSTFCLKTFDFSRVVSNVPVTDFFGDKQRLRNWKNKPLTAQQQCKSSSDSDSLCTWQTPKAMQFPHEFARPPADDTATIQLLEQRHVSDDMMVALIVVMLVAVVTCCRLPGKSADGSKKMLTKQFNLRAAAHT